ncbi:hypothetical protein J7643_01690 [bacterium]|nr:hypothetical protein [bacterium]
MNRRFAALIVPALMASVFVSAPAIAKPVPVAKVSAVSAKHEAHKATKSVKKKAHKAKVHGKKHRKVARAAK